MPKHPCHLINLNDEAKGIFSVIQEDALNHSPFKSEISDDGFIRQVGQSSLHIARDFVNFVTFIGELLVAFLYTSDILKHSGEKMFFFTSSGQAWMVCPLWLLSDF